MEKTIVCVYGKGNNVSEVFARLSCLHKRSEGEKYIYCAVIDLPDWISYRSSVDFEIEEKAKRPEAYHGLPGYGIKAHSVYGSGAYRQECLDKDH